MNGNGSAGFVFSESRFAAHVGLSRDDAKKLRKQHLAEGVDWAKKDREIALSKSAIKKLWRGLECGPNTLDLSACLLDVAEQNQPTNQTSPLALPEPVTFARPAKLRVARIFPNVRILQAVEPCGDTRHVIVGDNTLFVVGMELPAAPSAAHPGYYQLVGKLPRRRGRWN